MAQFGTLYNYSQYSFSSHASNNLTMQVFRASLRELLIGKPNRSKMILWFNPTSAVTSVSPRLEPIAAPLKCSSTLSIILVLIRWGSLLSAKWFRVWMLWMEFSLAMVRNRIKEPFRVRATSISRNRFQSCPILRVRKSFPVWMLLEETYR
jgi:hypothetical protein